MPATTEQLMIQIGFVTEALKKLQQVDPSVTYNVKVKELIEDAYSKGQEALCLLNTELSMT